MSTAVQVIDQGGLQNFTMGAVADRLQVQTMALYQYLPNREHLLDAIVTQVLTEVRLDSEHDDAVPATDDARTWQDFLARSAHEIRRVALAHPQVFPLVATRPPEAPWVRPPLRSLPWMEHFAVTLHGYGFTPAQIVTTYRAFASFLLGYLLLEVLALGVDVAPASSATDTPPEEDHDLSAYPVLARAEDVMREDMAQDIFQTALAELTDRIRAHRSPSVHQYSE